MTCFLDMRDFNDAFFEEVKEVQKKVSLCDHKEKRNKASFYGRVLLGYMLKRAYGMDSYKLSYGENGKPYLETGGIFFSISHSDDLVLCSVGEREIGADVQSLQEYKPRVAKRFFAVNEVSYIEKAENKDRAFIKLWTLKESILKKEGTGISGGLDSYDFSCYLSSESFSAYGCLFSCFGVENYEIAICTEGEKQSLEKVIKEDFERYVREINT